MSQPSVNTMSISGSGVPSAFTLASAVAPVSDEDHFPPGSIWAIFAATLEIPDHLIDWKKGNDICLAYAKHLAILNALDKLSEMSRSGTWKLNNTNDDVVEIFLAKSSYYRNHTKVFPLAKYYPAMKKWLEEAEDALADEEGDMKDILLTIWKGFLLFMRSIFQLKGRGKEREGKWIGMALLHLPFLWRSKNQRRIRRIRGKRRLKRRRLVGLVKLIMVINSKYICNHL